jgi:hypothetical protein
MHLVDIPYTPEIEEQFMGRAVRQGNEIKKVDIYKYNTNGTFDEVKREILKEKSNWQKDLLENISSGGVNEIENNAIDQDEVIAEAIERFGVNFTKDNVATIIQEKKDKQAEALQKEREFKKVTVKNEFEKIQKVKNYIESEDYWNLTSLVKLEEDYSETAGTYKIQKEKDFFTKYKTFIKKTDEAIKNILNSYASFDNLSKTPEEYEESLKQAKTDFFNKEVSNYRVSEYIRAYHKFQSDKITVYRYPEDVEIKNPLTPIQKKQLEELVNNTFDNYISSMVKKYEAIKDNDEIYKTTIKSVIDVVDDDEKPLYEALLNDEAVSIKGEIVLKKDTVKIYEVMNKDGYHFKCYKFSFDGKDFYINENFLTNHKIYIPDEIKITSEKYAKKPDNYEDLIQSAISMLDELKKVKDEVLGKTVSSDENGDGVVTKTIKKRYTTLEYPSDVEYVKIVTRVEVGRTIKAIQGEFISGDRQVELDTIIHQHTSKTEHEFFGFNEDGEKVPFAYYTYRKNDNYGDKMEELTILVREMHSVAKINGYLSLPSDFKVKNL